MVRETTTRRNVLKSIGVMGGGFSGAAQLGTGLLETVRINVGYKTEAAEDLAQAVGDTRLWEFPWGALTIEVPSNVLDWLPDHEGIRYVEEDPKRYTTQSSGPVHDRYGFAPWGVDRIDAEVAHNEGYSGDEAHIAIIDSGIDPDHPDLVDNLGEGKAFVDTTNSPEWAVYDDDAHHGTHVAGIAAGTGKDYFGTVGVAPEATVHSMRVTKNGTGNDSDISKSLHHAADRGWDVANISLGHSGKGFLLQEAIKYAKNRGVFVVTSAGNEGPCTDCQTYPGVLPEIVSVSATDRDDTFHRLSSAGPGIDLAAPGGDIYSTVPDDDYGTHSGTSMASPHVAGAAALLMSEGHTREEAEEKLFDTAEDIGLPDNEQGHGLVNVDGALGLDSSDDL